ncbi:hypothetical protein [Phaeobacter sp.]|uniref:hypothetical protein n=1 Tax=Phaeobacter sp. TaxID=1902409 RepID=UPI0025D1FC6C|nr:hypothetical protein [Phaeobacter sp.]
MSQMPATTTLAPQRKLADQPAAWLIGLAGVEAPVIRIESDTRPLEASVLNLPPPFTRLPSDAPLDWQEDWTIESSLGPLESQWPDANRSLGVFRPGSSEPFCWTFETLSAEECVLWLEDERAGARAFMHVDLRRRRILLREDKAQSRWLSRMVRNIHAAYLVHTGWQPLHACAFPAGGRIVVCIGQRGAGKSTLSYLAAQRAGGFFADDMVLIRPTDDGECKVLGWPGRLAVRRKVLEQTLGAAHTKDIEPRLRRGLAQSHGHPRGDRFAFDHDEIAPLLGIDYVTMRKAPLRIARIEAHAGYPELSPWTLGGLHTEDLSHGRDRRHFTDLVGFYRGTPSAVEHDSLIKSIQAEVSRMQMPFDLTEHFDNLWQHLVG